MATVRVAYDNLPDGKEVEIIGLGLLVNGQDNEVDDDRWERFKEATGYSDTSLTTSSTTPEPQEEEPEPEPEQEE